MRSGVETGQDFGEERGKGKGKRERQSVIINGHGIGFAVLLTSDEAEAPLVRAYSTVLLWREEEGPSKVFGETARDMYSYIQYEITHSLIAFSLLTFSERDL